ncbi:MAG: CorA family divalent cation transporter [Rhodospirillales bacterium]
MTPDDGFVFTGVLDGEGGARLLDVDQLAVDQAAGQVEWVHLDITKEPARRWLAEQADVPSLAVEGMLAPDTEPRCAELDDGILLILREVNTHENARPDDMISLRLWIGPHRIISGRLRHLAAIEDIKVALAKKSGPGSVSQFLCAVGHNMAQEKAQILADVSEELDEIDEDLAQAEDTKSLRPRIARLRRRAIQLHRFFKPQRAAFADIADRRPSWVDEAAGAELSELSAEFGRLAADIEAILGRAQVTQDEMRSFENQRANDITTTLTVVAAIFLPLGFVTGLLGINVGGVPLADSKTGFWVICGGLAVLGVGLWLYFRNKKYI